MFKQFGNTRAPASTMLRNGVAVRSGDVAGKPWRLWLFAFAAFLVACVAFAPASWLAAAVAKATQGKVRLVAAQGTVWRGSAAVVLTPGGKNGVPIANSGTGTGASTSPAIQLESRLSWKLRPQLQTASGWLGLSAELQAACCITGTLRIETAAFATQPGKLPLQISNSTLSLPLGLLKGLGAPWNTLGLEGQLTARTENLAFEHMAFNMSSNPSDKVQSKLVQGRIDFDVRTASSALSPVAPVGNYSGSVVASADGQALDFKLENQVGKAAQAEGIATTVDNPLSLEASGDIQLRQRRLSFAGTASARADMEASLGNLLGLIGQRQGRVAQIALQSKF